MRIFFTTLRQLGMAIIATLALAITLSTAAVAHGNKAGLDIKIRAQNRSTVDTPFCATGGGEKGDTLTVNVQTDDAGAATGTAVFTAADGTETVIPIDKVFTFFGGLALQDSITRNTVAIWLAGTEEFGSPIAPVHVNVELDRGCGNTVSTFTVDVDKVTMQIKFQ